MARKRRLSLTKNSKKRKLHHVNPKKRRGSEASSMVVKKQRSGGEAAFMKGLFDASSGAAGNKVYDNLSIWAKNKFMNYEPMEAVGKLMDVDAVIEYGLAGVPEAAAVAGAMYLGGKALESLFNQTKTNVTAIQMSGYSGKAAKMSKAAKTLRDKYQAYGAVVINEVYGSVADPDMVGVGQTTFASGPVARCVAYALLRKLFLLAKCRIETTRQEIPLINLDASGVGFTLRWQTSDSNGTNFNSSYAIPDDATLESLCAVSGFSSVIYDMFTDENPKKLERVALYMNDTDIPNYIVSSLIMKQEVIDCAFHVHTIVQNRTRAASGAAGAGSASIDQIDVQPVKGPVFQFLGIPKTKQANNAKMNESYNQGVYLVRAANLGGSDVEAWREPPVKASFSNVLKSGYTRLNPGQMKDFSLTDRHRGYFQNIVAGKWKFVTEESAVAFAPGRSQVVFLEEELNSGSLNNIQIQYETQHTICVRFITSKAPNMQPAYEVENVNNIP